jgi:hypothetical protein
MLNVETNNCAALRSPVKNMVCVLYILTNLPLLGGFDGPKTAPTSEIKNRRWRSVKIMKSQTPATVCNEHMIPVITERSFIRTTKVEACLKRTHKFTMSFVYAKGEMTSLGSRLHFGNESSSTSMFVCGLSSMVMEEGAWACEIPMAMLHMVVGRYRWASLYVGPVTQMRIF